MGKERQLVYIKINKHECCTNGMLNFAVKLIFTVKTQCVKQFNLWFN